MSTLLAMTLLVALDQPKDTPSVLVVVGAPGSDEYKTEFHRWASLWRAAAGKASAQFLEIGEEPEAAPPDRERLRAGPG